MRYLLDTNICIYLIKSKPKIVYDKFNNVPPGDIAISSITLSELAYGVQNSQYQEKNQKALTLFTAPLDILPFDGKAALYYGKIRAELAAQGKLIGPMDLLIAAHALSEQLTLITNNEKEFSRVSDLNIENWAS